VNRPSFLHAADLHLGAPLAASLESAVGPAKADHLQRMARRAFDELVDVAIAQGVSFVVFAGDVYDTADREVGAQVRFAHGLMKLHQAGIQVFIAHGNHDPLVSRHRPAAALPPNVTVFDQGAVQVHRVEVSDGSSVAVAGVSFGALHEPDNLARRFHHLPVADERCVAVLHANVDGSTGHHPYAPCSVADLRDGLVAYWALGHVHQRIANTFGGSRWWAYSGNLQGRSTKPSECGPKGALVVPFTPQGVAEPEFVACDQFRFERLDVDVSGAADVADAVDLLCIAATGTASAAGERPVLLRARLVGSTRAHEHLADERADLADVVRAVRPELMGDGELLRIDIATSPAVDRSQLLDRGDLLAALLQRLDTVRALDDTDLHAEVSHCAADLGDASTRGIFAELCGLDPSLLRLVVDDVERRFLDALVERS
jgi:DNA repair protein SbcD/Mre11